MIKNLFPFIKKILYYFLIINLIIPLLIFSYILFKTDEKSWKKKIELSIGGVIIIYSYIYYYSLKPRKKYEPLAYN